MTPFDEQLAAPAAVTPPAVLPEPGRRQAAPQIAERVGTVERWFESSRFKGILRLYSAREVVAQPPR